MSVLDFIEAKDDGGGGDKLQHGAEVSCFALLV